MVCMVNPLIFSSTPRRCSVILLYVYHINCIQAHIYRKVRNIFLILEEHKYNTHASAEDKCNVSVFVHRRIEKKFTLATTFLSLENSRNSTLIEASSNLTTSHILSLRSYYIFYGIFCIYYWIAFKLIPIWIQCLKRKKTLQNSVNPECARLYAVIVVGAKFISATHIITYAS